MEIVGYIALVGIGLILGMIGGGGSLLSIPILVYLFSMDVVTASSYSLFIVGMTSLVGAWIKQKEQRLDLRLGFVFGINSMLAIFFTRKWIIPNIPDILILSDTAFITKRALVLAVFAALAMASSIMILWQTTYPLNEDEKPRMTYLILAGVVTGALIGFVGAGGGCLILPALVFFARLQFRIAVGTTLLIIAFNSLLGFIGDVMNYTIDWVFLLLITCLAILGMLIGSISGNKIPVRFLRFSFGWIMMIIGMSTLINELLL